MRDGLRRVAQVALGVFIGGAGLLALGLYIAPRYMLYVERFELDRERQKIENKHRIEILEIEAARDRHLAELEDTEALARMHEMFMAYLGDQEEGHELYVKYLEECARRDPSRADEFARKIAASKSDAAELSRLIQELRTRK